MDRFSVRMGFVQASRALQINSMDDSLRVSLWNLLSVTLFRSSDFFHKARKCIEVLYIQFYKSAVDKAPWGQELIVEDIRWRFFNLHWHHPYDLIEFMFEHEQIFPGMAALNDQINGVLEREKSGYRFVQGRFAAISSDSEISAIQAASELTAFAGASEHIQRALVLYADRSDPDYRNSIKESISAVESVSRSLTGKDDLSAALAELEKKRYLHAVLKQGFIKLYSYTNGESGIRHAILFDAHEVSEEDARYMLVTCSAFVNYLVSRYGG